ncbi:hypothetical protein C2G38_2026951 [Gigaspora rosea]|uniref:Uncharacterized protein n=1 Tax=Gigaspora rosea TaxID=44941 RepID=A0A397W8A2_9GLOM|nr:hypothetical protein C2G38_2026951 [Gigaspora rosea]
MGDKIRSKYNSENNSDSDDDDNNVTYYGDPILAIEWNEAALIQRNVQKNTILTCMYINYLIISIEEIFNAVINICSIDIRSFRGCMPFPNTDQTQSDSLFFVVKRPGVPAQQIIYSIVYGIQRTYAQQRNVPTLGRVYTITAEKKNTFEASEVFGVFAP